MKKIYALLPVLILFFGDSLFSQVISEFYWDSSPVTKADYGTDAYNSSSSATVSAGGVGGTNGLNPGSPKMDVDLDITASPEYDVNGIDIQIDFRRRESVGDFFTRGSDLIFGMINGNLNVSFRLDDGAGGYTTVNSGDVYSIPLDFTFRTYRFFYNPGLGEAEVRVNGITVWNYTGTSGVDLYWSAPDIRIGNLMDANGENIVVFDNLIIGEVVNSPLPVELVEFSCEEQNNEVKLKWSTASESYNDYFAIERSKDGSNFEEIGRVKGTGNSNSLQNYQFVDEQPYLGVSYYRLKQVDFDGRYELFDIKSIEILDDGIKIFPIPATDYIIIQTSKITDMSIINSLGQIMIFLPEDTHATERKVDISFLPEGIYFLRTPQKSHQFIKK